MGFSTRILQILYVFLALSSAALAAPDDNWDGAFNLQGLNGEVYAIAPVANGVYVGGAFTQAGGVQMPGVAFWNGSTWQSVGGGVAGTVNAIAVRGTNVYVGGLFGSAGSVAAVNNIALWNGSAWSKLTQGASNGVNFAVRAIAVATNGDVYVGGDFSRAGTITAHNIARYTVGAWTALGVGLDDSVYGLCIDSNQNVYAGGAFFGTYDLGTELDGVGKWNGSSWSSMAGGVDFAVVALATGSNNLVYAGGSFDVAGGNTAHNIARWNGSAWSNLGSGLSNDFVWAIAISGTNVYAGGDFNFSGNTPNINSIARINGSNISPMGSGMDDSVFALGAFGNDVYAGGAFTNAGLKASRYFAHWNELLPSVNVAVTDANAAETGSDPAVFTVTRAGATAASITVNYVLSGTATAGVDYNALPGTVTLGAGVASAPVTITPIDDSTGECPESVILTIVAGPGYNVGATSSATATIADNELATVSVTATDPNASEFTMDPGTFTISRAGCNTIPLTVNYTVGGTATPGGDYNALPGTITIPANAASTNIVVTPVDDGFSEGNESVTLTISSNAGYAISPSGGNATITIFDNETQSLVVQPTAVTVLEGSTGLFTVKLSSQPFSNMVVHIAFTSGDSDLSLASSADLTFTTNNWNVLQNVTIAAAEDADFLNGSATFTVSAPGLISVPVTATEGDNDTLNLFVTPTSLSIPEGGTNTFTVQLTAQPTNTVTVTAARTSGDTDISVTGGASLSFNSGDWNVPKTVTLVAAEDLDAANGSATITVSAPGLTSVPVTATEADNDSQGLIVSTSAISVPEGGNNTFTVRLAAQPAGTVSVNVARTSGDTDLSVTGGTSLTFNAGDWNSPKTVTVSAADDLDAVNGTATIAVTSTGITSQNVTASETDNDTQGLILSTTSLSVPEGSTNTFTVRLAAQPTNTVSVTIARTSGDTDLSMTGGASLSFNAGDWNVPKTVTLSAAQDADTANGTAAFTISSAGLPSQIVNAAEVDDDTINILVSVPAISVNEGGSATFSVSLSAQPTTNIVVNSARTAGDSDLNVTIGGSLTFTPQNYSTPQVVTVSAAEDPDTANGVATITSSSPGLANTTVMATENDNDALGILVSTNSITVAEGASSTFTVVLTAQPTNNVSVTTSRTAGDTDLSVTGGANLTFTSNNWNIAQTVTLSAIEDADAVNGAATFTVASTGLTSKTVNGTEVDNDVQGLIVSTAALSVAEGSTNAFTVRLNAQPTNTVAVTVVFSSGDSDLSVTGGASLSFNAGDWNVPKTVTLSAAEDVDTASGAATFTVASAGLTSQIVTATEVDNDAQGLVTSTSAITVPEGGTNTFTVRLSAQPTNTVSVSVSRNSGDTDLSATGGASLSFNSGDWNVPKTVTISAAEDFDVVNGSAIFVIAANGLSNQTVTATEVDNDTQALIVSTNAVTVAEGNTAQFTVRLAAQPSNNVSVAVARTAGDADLSVTGGANLTFTSNNWNVVQSVTVSAAEDFDTVNGSATITVSSAGLTSLLVAATESDNDTQGLIVSTNNIAVAEGNSNSFTVRLNAQPTNTVTVTTSRTGGDADLSVTGGVSLSFDAGDWNVPKTVAVGAAEDFDAVNGSATFTVSSAGLPSQTVAATEIENDTQGLIVSTNALTIAEGASGTFSVRLAAQPTNTVNVTISRTSGDSDLSVTGGATLSFNAGDWNIPKTVTLSAAEDFDAVNGSATFTVATSGLPGQTVTVTETDNDTQAIIVSTNAVTVAEGNTAIFFVRLAALPTNTVNVTAARAAGDADLNVTGGASLNFNAGNWNVPQAVTITASEDADAVNGAATITVASTGLPSQPVAATEADNDTLALLVSTTSITVVEGNSATFTVRLTAQPTNTVSVDSGFTTGDSDLSVTGGESLTFDEGDWNVPKTVTISAADDADAVNDSATFTVSSAGLPSVPVIATEADKDVLGLVVTPMAINVPEGGNNTFNVSLSAQPTGDVSVAVNFTSGDADLSGNTNLTFTTADWDQTQSVTINAAEDDDAVNGSATFTVSAVDLTDSLVTATENDNDTLALQTSSGTVTVPEGGTNTFTVVLTAQPTNDVSVSVALVSGDIDLTIAGGAALTFDTNNWNVPQTVSIAAAEDLDAANGSAVLSISAAGLVSQSVTASEADNDSQNFILSTTALNVPESSTNSFTVRLSAQPLADVVVAVDHTSGDVDVMVTGGASLTFTTNNWNVPQPVTLNALQDADAVNGAAVFTVSSSGIPDQTVNASEIDNDTQNLVINPGAIIVLEGGANTFTVALAAQPTGTVNVAVARTSGDADLSATGGANLSFDAGDWNVPKLVTISDAEDFDAVNGSATMTVSSPSLPDQIVTATESDNDSQALIVSTNAVTVAEASSNTFTVQLAAQPTNTVAVTVARTAGDTNITVTGGAALSFDAGNWNVPKTVTLSAASDLDAADGTATITVSSAGLPSQPVVATEADNDTQGLVVSTGNVNVPEGATATFTVRLAAQPLADVAVTVDRSSGDADLNVTGGANLTFTTVNWNVPQTVTLSALQDADAANGSATLTVASVDLPHQTVIASEVDNDTLGLSVSPIAVSVPEGGANTFSVTLTAQPTNTVNVTVARTAGDGDLNVTGGASLSFNAGDWNVPKTVTLSAAEDLDAVNSSATITVSSAGLTSRTVTATEADNDTQAIIVSTNAVTVSEGSTITFGISLAAQPTNNVIISSARTAGDTNITVAAGANRTFTTANWNVPQNVRLAAAEDLDVVNGVATITVTSPGLPSETVTATEADNDTLALIVSTNAVTIAEGTSATFTVRLNFQPGNDVLVSVARSAGDSDLNVTGGGNLVFTTANWNTPQTVSVTAGEDFDAVSGSATITVSSPSTPSQNVAAAEVDNDTLGLVVSTGTLSVPEGSVNTFTVSLSAQPTNTINVAVARTAGDSDIGVTGGALLSFDSSNWSVGQIVTLSGAEDADAINGSATITVSSTGLASHTLAATEADNDTLGLQVSTTSVTVPESASATFTVQLTAQPTNTISVNIARTTGDSDISVSGSANLSFNSNNWNVAQIVTLAGAEDLDAFNGTATITVSSSGFTSLLVNATEADNDTLSLQLSPASVSVSEGGTGTFTVRLTAQPTNTVNVSVARSAGDSDITVTGGVNLTFDSNNWSVVQMVTLSAVQDADAVNGAATITASATGFTSASITANEADNDTLDIAVAPTAITVNEGASNTFTVQLTAAPTNTLNVSVARSAGDTNLNVTSGANLSFDAGNWNVPQTVTVSASDDPDAVNGSATIAASATGLTARSITATEIDNDTLGLTVSTATLTVNEGSTNSFTVRFSAQPVSNTVVTISRVGGDTDLSIVTGTSLTFTPANWNVPQPVAIAAAHDVDVLNGQATFAVESAGLPDVGVTVMEADTDTLQIQLSTNAMTVPEGATNTFTVQLTAQPSFPVTVMVAHTSGDNDLTLATEGTLQFDSGNWDVPQTVAISAAQDDDALDGAATFTASSASLSNVTVTVTEADNETQALVLSQTSLNVPEGGSAVFTVKLAAQPPADLQVAIARTSGDPILNVSNGASLTFTPSNWNTAQTVTVTSGNDDNFTNSTAVLTVTADGFASQQVIVQQVDAGQFIPLVGTYYGLAAEETPMHGTSGFLTLKLAGNGAASGNLLFGGSKASFKASFNSDGDLATTVTGPSGPLSVQLHIANGQITGTIGNGVFTSQVLAKRAAFSKTTTTLLFGPYTILFSPDVDAPVDSIPQGFGYGTLTVALDGKIKLGGLLADGAKFKPQKVALAKDGSFPFYTLLYKGGGSAFGWLTITNIVGESDLNGAVTWIKPAGAGAFYPAGFAETLDTAGSRFTPAVGLGATMIELGMGNLNSNIVKHATIFGTGAVAVSDPGADELKLKITPTKGTFKGSFNHPGKGGPVNVNGVIFKKQNTAGGFFLGTTESGFITIEEDSP